MADTPQPNVARLFNPWVFHLQKLGLELNCPLCLKLFTRPVLLPCDHIFCGSCINISPRFCSECSICKQLYSDEDLRSAPYMENIVNIYRSLDTALSTQLSQNVSSANKQLRAPSCKYDQTNVVKDETSDTPNISRDAENEVFKFPARKVMDDEIPKPQPKAEGLRPTINPVEISLSGSPPTSGDNTKGMDYDFGDHDRGMGSHKMNDRPPFSEEDRVRELKRPKKLKMDQNISCAGSVASSFQLESNKCEPNLAAESKFVCAFCQTSLQCQFTGPMLHHAEGKLVEGDKAFDAGVIHVHSKCFDWAPQVYYVGETVMNLEKEITRSAQLKCSSCGLKGAALGCYKQSCRKTYHVPCAVQIDDCRWDVEKFLVLCPAHFSTKFPNEKSKPPKPASKTNNELNKMVSQQSTFWSKSSAGAKNWVLCGSALSSEEKFLVVNFASLVGVTVTKSWNSSVTHVIAATDADGACARTFKVLMAITNGRWILTIDWIKACMEAMHPIDEELYEVRLDTHGCCGGPKTGRLRVLANEPKVFDGTSFYFAGEFAAPYKRDLQELISAAGGAVTQTVEELKMKGHDRAGAPSRTLVIYEARGCEAGDVSVMVEKLEEANRVAAETDSQIVPHTWLLESIAACKLQSFVCRF